MHASIVARMEVNPILVSIPQASQMLGRGASTIYDLIGAGKIRAVKSDGRTLVIVQSLHEYANSLPAAKVAPPRKRKPQHLRQAEAQTA
jgi:excisionase family DNA binding protein